MDEMSKVKKDVYKSWELFQVLSDAEWRRYKRKQKESTLTAQYHRKENSLRYALEDQKE